MSAMHAPMTTVAGVRGAIPVRSNTAEDILSSTARLLTALIEINRIRTEQIVSVLFTATEDLDADFPAHAARRLGWTDVPLLGAREISVPGTMPRLVRVLMTVAGVPAGTRLRPVYLDEAASLRPDLAAPPELETKGPTATARDVAIIGLGQIGGSIGLALARTARWRRVGYDLDAVRLQAARDAGALDRTATDIASACRGAAIAVLATPVDTLPAVVEAAAQSLPRGAALLDTGGTRAPVTPALQRAKALGIAAVGGHPLAGTEAHGFAAARADLFEGATFALSPMTRPVPEVVTELVAALGARPLEVEGERHDAALARTSHLPYLVACALREVGEEAAQQGLSGPSYRDMTRPAASDARVALATCRANAREVRRAWRELRASVERHVAALERPEAGGRGGRVGGARSA